MQICYLRPYLGNETDFCRLHVAKDAGKDGNDWNLKKLGHCIFQVLNDMPEEIFQKTIIMITVVSVPWWNLFEIFFITLQEHFVYDFSS